MSVLVYVGAAVVVLANVVLASWLIGRLWLRWRGTRVVTCPDNEKPAAVEVDAFRASREALRGRSGVTLRECSRWPEKAGCGQECLKQIEAAPDDCLLRSIIAAWYKDKTCALCGRAFGEIHWHDHQPGLLDSGGRVVAWSSVPAELVHETTATHRPLCWDCQVSEEFRAQHPARVTDR
jgi:hypothetical protein